MMGMQAGQRALIASPRIVDDFIRDIPDGQHVDVKDMRDRLAAAHGADVMCPLTAGIFLRIVAEAAYESYAGGKKMDDLTPVWRVIDPKTPTVKKLTFDPDFLWNQRKREDLPV